MDETTAARISNLIGVATDGDSTAIGHIGERIAAEGGRFSADEFIHELRVLGIPRSEPIIEDIDRIFEGKEPRYFITAKECVRRYRRRHGGQQPEWEQGFYHISERRVPQMGPFGHLACPAEQRYFYQTEDWAARAKVIRVSDKYRCRHCRRDGLTLHVHHLEPIWSAWSGKFHHNFEGFRLYTLCEACHERAHEGKVKTKLGFRRLRGMEAKEKQKKLREMKRRHDEQRECSFCQRYVWW